MFLMFVLMAVGEGVVVWLAFARVSRHLQGNPDGVKAVSEHVLIPLLGRRRAEDDPCNSASKQGESD